MKRDERLFVNPNLTVSTNDIEHLTNAICDALECGDVVRKVSNNKKTHCYFVAYKKDNEMSLIYCDHENVEEVYYEKDENGWAFVQKDITEIDALSSEQIAKITALLSKVSIVDELLTVDDLEVVNEFYVNQLGSIFDSQGNPLFPLLGNGGKILTVNNEEDGVDVLNPEQFTLYIHTITEGDYTFKYCNKNYRSDSFLDIETAFTNGKLLSCYIHDDDEGLSSGTVVSITYSSSTLIVAYYNFSDNTIYSFTLTANAEQTVEQYIY